MGGSTSPKAMATEMPFFCASLLNAGHLFVDEMKTFNDPSHAKHIVRRSSVCKGAIIVGAEDKGYSRRVGGMPPARPDGAGARLDSSNPPTTASGHSRNLRPSRPRSALTSIADMPLRCGNRRVVPIASCWHRSNWGMLYSMSSSAVVSNDPGISRPSALATFRLTTSSYLVGAWTGSSLGLAPLRMRFTYSAACLCNSIAFGS